MSLTGKLAALATAPFLLAQLAAGQSPNPAPKPADPNMQFMEQVMRTATAVHDLVKSMNLEKALNSQPVYPPGDPRNLQRTADFMGVGAGVGLALGEMSHSQKGVLIGAAAGTAGGLIVDQLLRHQAAKAQAAPPPGE
jgi:hypothetical protein